jgi:hypothetical protein
MLRNSWVAEQQMASQKGLSSMKLVNLCLCILYACLVLDDKFQKKKLFLFFIKFWLTLFLWKNVIKYIMNMVRRTSYFMQKLCTAQNIMGDSRVSINKMNYGVFRCEYSYHAGTQLLTLNTFSTKKLCISWNFISQHFCLNVQEEVNANIHTVLSQFIQI